LAVDWWGYTSLLVIAILGWKLAKAVKAPASALLGPMLLVAAVQTTGVSLPNLPALVNPLFQLVLGTALGTRVDREKLVFLKDMVLPTLVVVGWTIGTTALAAEMLVLTTDLGLASALFGATPGGIVEVSVIAMSYGADTPMVVLLQLVRMILVIIIIPLWVIRTFKSETMSEQAATREMEDSTAPSAKWQPCPEVLISGLIIGLFFLYLGFPAGPMIGAMIGVGASNVLLNRHADIPERWHQWAQIGVGVTVGLQFGPEVPHQFASLILVIMLFSAVIVLSGILLAFLLKSMTGWEFNTCLLCAAPAGLIQMVVVANDIGVDVLKVVYFQLMRLLTIYLLLQPLFHWYLTKV